MVTAHGQYPWLTNARWHVGNIKVSTGLPTQRSTGWVIAKSIYKVSDERSEENWIIEADPIQFISKIY